MTRFLMILLIFLFASVVNAQDINDYLITTDIGSYEKITKGGPSGSILAGTGHFYLDHQDAAYGISYVDDEIKIWIDVQVTQHTGGDSDQWLLHEVEDMYRQSDTLNESLSTNVIIRTISNNNIYFMGIYGGKNYTWISSNNIVVDISCSKCPNTNQEPLEVVQAYLQRFPSSITLTDTQVKSSEHTEQWLKDEMARRLWLCDKWLGLIVNADPELSEKLENISKNLIVFLNYREKYFDLNAKEDKKLVYSYREQNNEAGMRAKVTELKVWWNDNKNGSINLP